MFTYKTKYRIVLQDKHFYLQKKVGFFRNWEYIMVQMNVGNYRPIICTSWDEACMRLKKYISDHKTLDRVPITAWVKIDHII